MGRKMLGLLALVAGLVAVVVSASAAAAQTTYELFPGPVTTERVQITTGPVGNTKLIWVIRVTGDGFPNEFGCAFGVILAVPQGGTLEENALEFDRGVNMNNPGTWTSDAPVTQFPPGSYTMFITCNEQATVTYRTDATFTILETDVAEAPPVTEEPPAEEGEPAPSGPSTQATSVDPTTATPGVTVLTVRGSGFAPDATLSVTLDGNPPTAVASTKATPTGEYAATLKLPANAPPGQRQLVVTGLGPDGATRSTTTTLTVQDLSCADFPSSADAQAALGPGALDVHGLDADKDGVACEKVSARSGSGGGTAAAATAAPGTLPATGPQNALAEVVVALVLLTAGSLLVGLSHPAARSVRRHFDPSIRL